MSVQGATIKRVEFLTSRWDYDIPHKFVWCVDIYGVDTDQINNVLNQFERRSTDEWPVEPLVSLESIRAQFGFNGLAQAVQFPTEGFDVGNISVENSGGFIQGLAAQPRYAYSTGNKVDITFLETNIDTIDYFIKPWSIAAAHKGLIEDGVVETNIKATIDAYMYARADNRNSVPTLRKHITFHKCVPFVSQADEVSYGDLGYNDIARPVSFVFQRYTINKLNAPRPFSTPPTIEILQDKGK
jgi:hypothetical protein